MHANLNGRFLIEYKRYIHLNTMHFRNFEFGRYLLVCSYTSLMECFFLIWQFFAHKMPKFQKSTYQICVTILYLRKIHIKFQVPNMHGVQMNVSFVNY